MNSPQAEVPIEQLVKELVKVVKLIQSNVPEGTTLPEIVDRVLEPVSMMLFQAILNELDPDWNKNILDHLVQPSTDSFWISEPDTMQ
jgi:hypothetical protein